MGIKILALGATIAILTSSCVNTSGGVSGSLYTSNKAPVSFSDKASAAKQGKSCSEGVLGIAWGDGSVEAAKTAGNIKEVSTVNVENFSVLGVYAKSCTIITGN